MQPDYSFGFPDLEDRPFGVAETGYSDSQTLTRQRVQSWLSEGRGQVTPPEYDAHNVDQNWLCNQLGRHL